MKSGRGVLEILDWRGDFLVRWPAEWTREAFLSACEAERDTYINSLAERVYECMTGDVLDLTADFRQYYAEEYQDLPSFISERHDVEPCVVDAVLADALETDIIGFGNLASGGEYELAWFLSREEGSQLLEAILNRLGSLQ